MELIGEGRTARIFRNEDRAVKVFSSTPNEWAQEEAKNQAFACEAVPAIEMDYAAVDFIAKRGMGRDERTRALSLLQMISEWENGFKI